MGKMDRIDWPQMPFVKLEYDQRFEQSKPATLCPKAGRISLQVNDADHMIGRQNVFVLLLLAYHVLIGPLIVLARCPLRDQIDDAQADKAKCTNHQAA